MAVATPTAEAVVAIWERGRSEHPVDRALTVLAGCTGGARSELADWPLERRDAALAAYRATLFGPRWAGYAACPACGCGVDVALGVPAEPAEPPGPPGTTERFEVAAGGVVLSVRMPTSRDLAAAAGSATLEDARLALLRSCVTGGFADPAGVRPEAGAEALAAVEAELDRRAGLSAGTVAVTCPECSGTWALEMDVGAFFWREIEVLAGRLLREVDALARRYGWTEAEILGLSPARRRYYLELAT